MIFKLKTIRKTKSEQKKIDGKNFQSRLVASFSSIVHSKLK